MEQKEIKVLPAELANMIAAGEVVERATSVVKELLENAVDAGATSISVEITKGGHQSIRVTDNGGGIPKEQLERAFLRHATSKLQKAEHLSEISTLGFRGEALAAIAAVSKITVISATKMGELANLLRLHAGAVVEKEETVSPVGTTMLVEDLFYNTPARKKFMKSERSEGSAIYSMVQEVALSHPEISIKFIRDGKEEMKTVGDGTLESAVFHVLGKNIAAGLREISLEDRGSAVHGFVSLPSCCRASRSFQHFFVNGRYIKSTMLMAALEEAYKNQKMVGRFPAAVLHVNLAFDEVDVNVHPAKTQVKFAHEEAVFKLVYRGVFNGLSQYSDIQKVEFKKEITNSTSHLPKPSPLFPEKQAPKELAMDSSILDTTTEKPIGEMFEKKAELPAKTTDFLPVIAQEPSKKFIPKVNFDFSNVTLDDEVLSEEEPVSKKKKEDFSLAIAGEKALTNPEEKENQANLQENPNEFEEIPLDFGENDPPWRVVGEFFRTYIAVEVGEEIFLVDKHAAHERMNFERLKAQDYKPMAQVLLKPLVLQVSPQESEILLENLPLLREFSFDIEEFSVQSLIIREAPYDIDVEKIGETLLDLAQKLICGHFPDPSSARDHLLHSMACKSAIKAGYLTGPDEQNLLAKIVMNEEVRHCPHGRPIVASLSKKELEKKFKRIL